MDTLFTHIETARRNDNAPLAARMRPRTLDGYFGQEQAVGPGSWLRRAIEHDTLSSVILYGPAGTGKTTLARIVAHTTHAEFVEVSAITGTVKDLRREIESAESRLLSQGRRTILSSTRSTASTAASKTPSSTPSRTVPSSSWARRRRTPTSR